MNKVIPTLTIKPNKPNKRKNVENFKKMIEPKKSGEIDELVDDDGTMLSSRIPNLDQTLHPHKTLDQTINMTRQTGNPYGGRRSYYGEGTKNKGKVVSEDDMSGAFGFEETEFQDYDETVNTLEDMVLRILKKEPMNLVNYQNKK